MNEILLRTKIRYRLFDARKALRDAGNAMGNINISDHLPQKIIYALGTFVLAYLMMQPLSAEAAPPTPTPIPIHETAPPPPVGKLSDGLILPMGTGLVAAAGTMGALTLFLYRRDKIKKRGESRK